MVLCLWKRNNLEKKNGIDLATPCAFYNFQKSTRPENMSELMSNQCQSLLPLQLQCLLNCARTTASSAWYGVFGGCCWCTHPQRRSCRHKIWLEKTHFLDLKLPAEKMQQHVYHGDELWFNRSLQTSREFIFSFKFEQFKLEWILSSALWNQAVVISAGIM